jgi:hypothetical protein
LDDYPDGVSRNLIEIQMTQVGVELATNPPNITNASKVRFEREVPYNRFLPRTLGLYSEVRFVVCRQL